MAKLEERAGPEARKLFEQFQHGDFAEALQTVYQYFHGGAYSLKLLFRDEQRRILRIVLESSQKRIEAAYRHIYETDAPLIHFVDSLNMPLPSGFQMAADVVLNTDLRRAFEVRNEKVHAIG